MSLNFEVGAQREASLVSLNNPILDDATRMRPTLLPGLLESVRHNLNHGSRDVRLFEIGRIFAGSEVGELPAEREALGMVATGGSLEEGRARSGVRRGKAWAAKFFQDRSQTLA